MISSRGSKDTLARRERHQTVPIGLLRVRGRGAAGNTGKVRRKEKSTEEGGIAALKVKGGPQKVEERGRSGRGERRRDLEIGSNTDQMTPSLQRGTSNLPFSKNISKTGSEVSSKRIKRAISNLTTPCTRAGTGPSTNSTKMNEDTEWKNSEKMPGNFKG